MVNKINDGYKLKVKDLYVTAGIDKRMNEDRQFRIFVHTCLGRFVNCDWGNTCMEDQKLNYRAVENHERILAEYIHKSDVDKEPKLIWIIADPDMHTTILFPHEY